MPRILLQNYSHRKRTGKNKCDPNNRAVRVLDLSNDNPVLSEQRVDRTFERYDMRSTLTQNQESRIETELGRLENDVTPIFEKLLQAQSGSESTDVDGYTKLLPSEMLLLKKFIFIMRYRSQAFFNKFNYDNIEAYQHEDKSKLLQYMRSKNLLRPIDVWFDNICHMLTLKVQGEIDWYTAVEKLIYIEDALWLQNMVMMYPVTCTPCRRDEEFVVTGDAFCLPEGQNDNLYTTKLHIICIVSPRLAVLMRHALCSERVHKKTARRKHDRLAESQLLKDRRVDNITSITSLLGSLPVVKPRNTYREDSNGRLIYSWSDTSKQDKRKPLCFPIFKINTENVQIINSLILNEAHDVQEIVYRSKSSMLLAIEPFLGISSDEFYGIKTFSVTDDRKVAQLRKLEMISHSLGSKVKAVYEIQNTTPRHGQMIFLANMDENGRINLEKSRLRATASGP